MDYIQQLVNLIWPSPLTPTSGSRLLSVAGSHVEHKKIELGNLQELVRKTQALRDEADAKKHKAEQSHKKCDEEIWSSIEKRRAALNKFTIQIKRIQNASEQEDCIQMLRAACVLADEFDTSKFTQEIDMLKEVRTQSQTCLESATDKVKQVDAHLKKIQIQCDHIVDHISTLERIQTQLSTSMEKVEEFTVGELPAGGGEAAPQEDTE